MGSLDLEFTLQNPEEQLKKSYWLHTSILMCVYYVSQYMTILLSHKVSQAPLSVLMFTLFPHGPEPLAWVETTFSPHRPGGRKGASMTPGDIL